MLALYAAEKLQLPADGIRSFLRTLLTERPAPDQLPAAKRTAGSTFFQTSRCILSSYDVLVGASLIRHPSKRSTLATNLDIAGSYRILFAVDPMPGLSIPHAPPLLGDDAHLTHSEDSQAHFCRPCNREFGEAGFHQHILTSPMHLRTCCKPCRRNFCSEKDRYMHWGTADAHKYTYDLWCNKNFENAESFLNHQRQSPQKHQVCKLCDIDFGPYELDLKKHLEEDGAHKDAYNRVGQIPLDGVKSFEHHQRDKPTKHPICLLCNSNHPSPCHLTHNTLEEFGFLNSLGNETHLPASEPSKLNTSNAPRIISEVAEDIFDDPQARSTMAGYTGDTSDLFLRSPESPNNLALNEVMKRRKHSKSSYCKICKVDFGTRSLLKEV